MTQPRDDFEHRLGQGLKRWAQAGKPSLDLEAYVRAQTTAAEAAPALPPRRRTQRGWLAGVAAAAALVLGLFATFPSWAGAATGLPVVGPVVKEIILKDAGLKWAYDVGVLQGTMAEATEGEVTARILGVMADQFRTTVIYQISGVEKPADRSEKPISVWDGSLTGKFSRPASTWPEIRVKRLPGQDQIFVSHGQPQWTPVGVIGKFTTSPVGAEGGEAEISLEYEGRTFPLSFRISRAEADKYSHEVAVGQSQTIDDVTVILHSVIYTPVETIAAYSVERPEYQGSWGASNREFTPRVEAGGDPVYNGYSYNTVTARYDSFEVVADSARLVIPALVKRAQGQITWSLEKGNVQRFDETDITLSDWTIQDGKLYVEWHYLPQGRFMGFDRFEVLDAAGNAYKLDYQMGSESVADVRPREKANQFGLPEGVTPVAIRATQVAVKATGPWIFDLPKP